MTIRNIAQTLSKQDEAGILKLGTLDPNQTSTVKPQVQIVVANRRKFPLFNSPLYQKPHRVLLARSGSSAICMISIDFVSQLGQISLRLLVSITFEQIPLDRNCLFIENSLVKSIVTYIKVSDCVHRAMWLN